MRHADKVKKLGRTKQHREALYKNLVTALFQHERIRTTLPKAKAVRSYVDRMISFGKQGDLSARREVARFIQDRDVVKKLFSVIAPRFKERPGGYTRIYQLGPRDSDGAEMAYLELVVREEKAREKQARADREKAGKQKPAKPDKKAAKDKAESAE